MSRPGKIGYALIYNSLFLLIIPLLRVFAGNAGWLDVLLLLLVAGMVVGGLFLLKLGTHIQTTKEGLRVIRMDPLVLKRDRLARNMVAGAMVWVNIYLLISTTGYTNPRANPEAWSFFNLLAAGVLAVAWLLFLTSPSDAPRNNKVEA